MMSDGRERLRVSFVATVLFVAAGCVQGGGTQNTATDERTTGGGSVALFEVTTSHPDYWRLFTLDRVDGTSSTPHVSEGVTLSTPTTLPPTLVRAPVPATATYSFRILSDDSDVTTLPIAPTANELDGTVGEISWDDRSERVIVEGGLRAGMEYAVRAAPIVPTPEELDRTSAAAFADRWTELPADLDPRFRSLAEQWTRGAASDYRKVLAIQERFQLDDFTYNTDVPAPTGPKALLDFLTRSKVGFCEHYSFAMAVLVRSLGIPARVAAGFRLGTMQDDGRYLVHASDVHVWVEARFAGYGWLPFEPEHGATHPYARPGTYLNP